MKSAAVEFILQARDQASATIRGVRDQFRRTRTELGGNLGRAKRQILDDGGLGRLGAQTAAFKAHMAQRTAALRPLGVAAKWVGGSLAALGIGVPLGGIASIVGHSARAGDALADLSERLGISAERLQEWGYAAELKGASSEDLATAFRGLHKNIGMAVNGMGEGREVFQALGIALTDGQGHVRDTGDVMLDLADRMARIPDKAQQIAVAQKLMEESGTKLLPVLAGGRGEIERMSARARELGIITQGQIGIFDKFGDATLDMKKAWEGVSNAMAATVLPAMQPIVDNLTNLLTANREAIAAWAGNLAQEVGAFVREIPWARIAGAIHQTATSVRWLVESMGGLGNIAMAVAGYLGARFALAVIGTTAETVKLGYAAQRSAASLAVMVPGQPIGAVGTFFTALKVGMGVMDALRLAFMTNPIGIVVTAIAVAAGLIWYYWDDIKKAFNSALDYIAPAVDAIAAYLKPAFAKLADLVSPLIEVLLTPIRLAGQATSWIAGLFGGKRDKSSPAPAPSAPEAPDLLNAGTGAPSMPSSPFFGHPVGTGASAPPAAPAPERKYQVVIRFENAPPGMRVVRQEGGGALDLSFETNVGRGHAGTGW